MNRLALIALAAALALTASACRGNSSSKASASGAPQRRLADLHDIGQLQTAFNTASKRPQLILFVSPT
jgi:hypothetical protein